MDSCGLTQRYLKALRRWDCDICGLVRERDSQKTKYMLFISSVKKDDIDIECPYCKTKTVHLAGKAKDRLVHDVTRNNYRVDIAIVPQLYRCKKCGNRFTQPISGIEEGRQMTTRLYEYIKKESFLQSHTALAEQSGFSIQTIQNIMDEQIEIYEQQRKKDPPRAPEVLGIDEKHIDNKMRGTLVDVKNGVLLEMLVDNKRETMQNAIKALNGWDKNIKVVTTDMNNSYINWLVTLLPEATVVIDKFHVIKDIHKRIRKTQSILYQYRKDLIMDIEDEKERNRQLGILRIVDKHRYLFRNSMETIERDTGDKAEQLSTVMAEFPEFAFLRNLYHMIEKMYDSKTLKEAKALWDQWQLYLPPNKKDEYKDWCDAYGFDEPLFKPFQTFTRDNFKYYEPYILNYFKDGCRYTNAATEGINKRIESIHQMGNGYKFKHLRAKALFAPLIGSHTIYSVDLKSIRKRILGTGFVTGWSLKSADSYTIIKKYVFSESIEKLVLNPTYIYDEDSENLIDIIYYETDTADILEIDEDSILNSLADFAYY